MNIIEPASELTQNALNVDGWKLKERAIPKGPRKLRNLISMPNDFPDNCEPTYDFHKDEFSFGEVKDGTKLNRHHRDYLHGQLHRLMHLADYLKNKDQFGIQKITTSSTDLETDKNEVTENFQIYQKS